MYKFRYDEVLVDDARRQKDNEKQAIEHSIAMLKRGRIAGANSREGVEALSFLNTLWGFLLEELAHPENALPLELRAKLISIGLWLIREADAIGDGHSNNFGGLIDVSQTIADGLQ